MTFGSMNNDVAPSVAPTTNAPPSPAAAAIPLYPQVPAAPTPANDVVVLKAFFGTDIRRATFFGGFASLQEVCTKIYAIDPATTVLKYQDEDGDKITMSTDTELQEALKQMKDNVLRVYVETKVTPATPQPEDFWGRWGHGPMRGHRGAFGGRGFGRRGGFHHGPHPHPHPPHHGFPPHPPHHGFPPHPPHHGFPPHSPHDGVETVKLENQHQDGSTASYSTARVHAHGVFTPAHCKGARADAYPYPRGDWKERKQAMKEMKEQFKYAKENQTMGKDEIKELKRMIKEQMDFSKDEWKAAKKAAKGEKYGEKKDKKDKEEKKREKKEKKERKEKQDRFTARHVADVTIPDNSEVPANTPVTKTWRLRNDGALAWPADSQLLFISHRGDDLNGPERVHVGALEPNMETDVSVTFVTPAESGRYTGYYRMATGEGRKFGQRVWVSFIIAQAAQTNAGAQAGVADGHDRLLDVNME